MHPYFSVVIPTYNRLDLLRVALTSVLNQTFSDFEVIVVDNCSTDGTDTFMQSVNDPRVQYIRNHQNEERAFSRNRGISLARGEFCTLLDSDDVMYPSCLQQARDFISANSSVIFFHGLYDIIDQHGTKVKDISLKPLTNQYRQLCEGNFISCIAVFSKTQLLQQFRFSEDRKMIGSEDYEIWLRVVAANQVSRINSVLCGMREHSGRSVYTDMYFNLEFQRGHILAAIQSSPTLKSKYGSFIHLINSNYYYHQAMFQLHLGKTLQGLLSLSKTIFAQPGILVNRRFAAMAKATLISIAVKSKAAG